MHEVESAHRELLRDAANRASAYLDSLPGRRVAPDPAALARLAAEGDGPLQDAPLPAPRVLAELDALVGPATVASAGPRYFGFVIGGVVDAGVAASLLAAAWDQNAVSNATSPAAALVESWTLRWLRGLLGLPEDAAGAFVTGATLANFTALAAARHAVLAKCGWDVEALGLFGAPQVAVAVGAEAHPTVRKGLGLLGLGRERVVEIPVDAEGRIRADALPALEVPAIVCAQAGNVNSGASDPFDALRGHCDRHGAWLHVDGAFGLWAAASPARRAQVRGVERADSWATDAHKWLNVPYDSGLCFVRDAAALRAAMAVSAPYLPVDAPREPFHYTPECSRRARAIEIWAVLRRLGRSGVAELVDRCCRQASRFASGLRAAGHRILNEVTLNQVVVDFGGEARCTAIVRAIQEEGVCWCGATRWRDRPAMRISVSGWSTTDEDVERSLESILRCAAGATKLRRGHGQIQRVGEGQSCPRQAGRHSCLCGDVARAGAGCSP